MGTTTNNRAVISGKLVDNYPLESEKKNHEALIKYHYGERCRDRCSICACCHMWTLFDSYWALMNEVVHDVEIVDGPHA